LNRLKISLLGQFQATLDGKILTGFDSDKVRALLAYLVVEDDRPHRREKLAGLFWPDYPERSARTSLRRALTNLRQVISDKTADPPYLLVTRQTIQFNPESDHELDARTFMTQAEGQVGKPPDVEKLEEAIKLYQSNFLEGFSLPDSAIFEEWTVITQEGLKRQALRAFHHLAGYYQEKGNYERALQFAQQQIELEPYQEDAHQQVMWLLALDGQRNAALENYDRFKETLERELGVQPLPETQEMYTRLVDGEVPSTLPSTVILRREPRVVGECPYRGLAAFREADAEYFHGRETYAERLVGVVNEGSLVAVIVGSSGAGKSSVVFAGLIPQLRKEGNWVVVDFRPGNRPFHALASAISTLLSPELSEVEQLVEANKLGDALEDRELPITQTMERVLAVSPGKRLLMVIDQFEELYTLCQDQDQRRGFLEALLDAAEAGKTQVVSPYVILLTLRADFMNQALSLRPFADALQDNSLILGPMNRTELREVIETPAEAEGAAFEAGLVTRILDDVGDEPGNLPLLEFALTLLWDRLDQGWMTHEAYESIGRVEGALAKYAEEVISELPVGEKVAAQGVFIQLVQPGQRTDDTRRVATMAELGVENIRLIQHLADKRLVVTSRDEGGNETVEVVHEALIRGWERLREWMNADRTFRVFQEGLRVAMRVWQSSDRDEGALLRGGPLAQAETWLAERGEDLSTAEVAYIKSSLNLRQRDTARREQRRRRITISLAIGLVVITILALFAWQQSIKAGVQARIAVARELAAASVANLDVDPERSILLALEAVNTTYSADKTILPEAEDALHRAVRETRTLHTIRPAGAGVFSPDTSQIVTGSPDGVATVWNVETGEPEMTLVGHTDAIRNIAFSKNGQLIATCSNDMTARVWDAETGQEYLTLYGHEAPLISPAFSPDGKYLATSSYDGTVRVWDLEHGDIVWVFDHPAVPGGVDFSPDGRRLAVAVPSSPGMAKIWDITTGQAVIEMTDYIDGSNDVVFTPDGDKLVTVSSDGDTKIRDAETGEILMTLFGHTGFIFGVDISDDGNLLATGGQDGKAKIWDLDTGQELMTLSGHASGLNNVSFSPDGRMLSADSADGSVKVWDITPQGSREWYTLAGHDGLVFGLRYSHDGKLMATASWDGTAKLWDALTGELILSYNGHSERVSGVDISPDGKYLATSSYDGTAKIVDIASGNELLTLVENEAGVFDVLFLSNGVHLATAGGDGSAAIWDAATGDAIQQFKGHQDWVFDIALSPDETRLATAGWDNLAIVWDVNSGEQLLTISGHSGQINSVSFDAIGNFLLTSSWDTTTKLWDLSVIDEGATNLENPTMTLEGHNALVWDSVFSPDGSRIATTAFDGNVKLWDSKSGQEVLTLWGGNDGTELAFSPDGSRLLTGSIGVIQVFALETQDLIFLANERLTRWFTPEECLKYLHLEQCPVKD